MCTCHFMRLLVCSVLFAAGATHTALAESDEVKGLKARIPQLMIERKWGEAVALAERGLELVRAQKGEDHIDTATALETLAGPYNIERRLAEAEALYKRALAIRDKTLGAAHPDTVRLLGQLGVVYRQLGRAAEAEVLEKRNREATLQQISPPNDPVRLRNEAGFHHARGELAEAERLYRQALAADEKQHGPNNPRTVRSLSSLADFCRRQGQLAEAEALLKRALAIREKSNEDADRLVDQARLYEEWAKRHSQEGSHTEAQLRSNNFPTEI
jgi:tetratricopeptide (TPR) repeat protein